MAACGGVPDSQSYSRAMLVLGLLIDRGPSQRAVSQNLTGFPLFPIIHHKRPSVGTVVLVGWDGAYSPLAFTSPITSHPAIDDYGTQYLLQPPRFGFTFKTFDDCLIQAGSSAGLFNNAHHFTLNNPIMIDMSRPDDSPCESMADFLLSGKTDRRSGETACGQCYPRCRV